MHATISPAILYWGTPVVLITTTNEDGSYNIAPMSSAWWLGHRCMLGLAAMSQTTKNLLRTKQCVLNLPSEAMTPHVNLLARTTGSNPVPEWKTSVGYTYVKDKFAHSRLTPQKSDLVAAPRILECPVQMEVELVEAHQMMKDLTDIAGAIVALEVKILRVHVEEELRLEGHQNRVNPDKLRLLFMAFQQYYGIGRQVDQSRLAAIDESNYRGLTRSAVASQGADTDEVEETALGLIAP